MVNRSYRDLFGIFGKWLGLYLKIYLNSRGLFGKMVGCMLILDNYRGFFTNVAGIFWLDLFSNGK
jgi:hypothetical protein